MVLLAKNIDLYLLLYFFFPLLILNYSLKFSPLKGSVSRNILILLFLKLCMDGVLDLVKSVRSHEVPLPSTLPFYITWERPTFSEKDFLR